MAKLYFKYGAMGSSKTASALMCRFNYVQKGMNVLLLKPKIDVRFKEKEVVSRIGLSAPCYAFASDENLEKLFEKENENQKVDVVIIDECQFCTKRQVEQLRNLTAKVPVLCYGLMTNFKTELFEGSKRLVELCDSLGEIKSICECGKKATLNGRFVDGLLCTDGEEVEIGADEKYKGLCYFCYTKEQKKAKIYDKIIKHLNILKNKDDAGDWSTDLPMDNIVLQKPFVVYDEEVSNFVEDFKDFEVKNPEKILNIDENIDSLRKVTMKDKDFDFMLALISLVLKIEKTKPGLLKALIEDNTITKWLKQIKKTVDHKDFE